MFTFIKKYSIIIICPSNIIDRKGTRIMARVNTVLLPQDAMYPVKDILKHLGEENLRNKEIYISPKLNNRILENLFQQMGGEICKYGDLYIPEGYSITLAKVNGMEDIYYVVWIAKNSNSIYNSQMLPDNADIYYFAFEGEETNKQIRALSRMRPNN